MIALDNDGRTEGEDFAILVVDDDPLFRESFVSLIKHFHTTVHEADSVVSALEIFKKQHPPVVFTDVNMPGLNGIELVRILMSEDPDVLVAVITGIAEEALAIDSLKAGATDFVRKPVSLGELQRVLGRFGSILNRRRDRLFAPEHVRRFHLELDIQNNPQALAPTVQYVLQFLPRFVGERELMQIGLGLNEILQNAFEHGNLGIDSARKQRLIDSNQFESTLKEACTASAAKKIRVIVDVEGSQLCCKIEDDGEGFDWRNLPDPTSSFEARTSASGRGIYLARKIFDTVTFNEKGNAVALTKRFSAG
jgi:CheY-like chemotaxis protein